jgi:hypothetical protein
MTSYYKIKMPEIVLSGVVSEDITNFSFQQSYPPFARLVFDNGLIIGGALVVSPRTSIDDNGAMFDVDILGPRVIRWGSGVDMKREVRYY